MFKFFQYIIMGLIAALALLVSFGIFGLAALVAERLFDTGGAVGNLVDVTVMQAVSISALVTAFVAFSALMAAWSALKTDPATVLREGAT